MCIVIDTSTPPLPLQSVTAFHLWHEGDLYNNWSAASLATPDDARLQAIADGIRQAYNVGLEDIHQVHVFSDSANMLHLTMDVSHHLGQDLSLSICKVLVPWLQHHPNNTVHFHHITDGMDLEDHQFAHIFATSMQEAGSAPVISANYARRGAVTWMLNGWNSLFWSKKYIGSNFLTLYQRKDTPLVLTHVNSGPWICKVGHSHSLTARLVRCTTGHAPIGAFQSRFFPEESMACRCGFPKETMSHIDEHSRAVHHRNIHLTYSRLTQTTPFTNQPTTLCRRSLYLICQSYLAAQRFSIDFTNCQPRTSRPTNCYPLNHLIPPCLFASNQQPTNVAHACPAFTMSNPAIKLVEPACSWSQATLPRKTLHVDCLPLFRLILYLVW
jgi:hypothetical protein